jgi:hypothetical protein
MVAFVVCDMTAHHLTTLSVVAQIDVASHICRALITSHEPVIGAFLYSLTFSIPGHFAQLHLTLVAVDKLW